MYRSQILQVNIPVKALAEIYTMHSFAPFGVEVEKKRETHPVDSKKPTTKTIGKKEARNAILVEALIVI